MRSRSSSAPQVLHCTSAAACLCSCSSCQLLQTASLAGSAPLLGGIAVQFLLSTAVSQLNGLCLLRL